ncbi:hypothetical protein OC845_002023 [Tilletia horrida]|nr:hypothetical protein OC845_002023 [Tilletia horrida]
MDSGATTYVLSPAQQPSSAPTPPWMKRAGDRLQAAYQDYLEECKEHNVDVKPFDIAFRLVVNLHPAVPYELRPIQATKPLPGAKDSEATTLNSPPSLPHDAASDAGAGPSSRSRTLRSFSRRDSHSSGLSWKAARWPKSDPIKHPGSPSNGQAG